MCICGANLQFIPMLYLCFNEFMLMLEMTKLFGASCRVIHQSNRRMGAEA